MATAPKELSGPASTLPAMGWREWVGLPDLDVPEIKAKVDTGARSSALHAYDVRIYERAGKPYVSFEIHPIQRDQDRVVKARAEVVAIRSIRSSTGQVELRPVIETTVTIGRHVWKIELTLTNRDQMGFRMLLGRQAIRQRFVVDGGRSYLQGKRTRRKEKK